MARTDDELEWPSYGFSFSRRLRYIRRHRNLTQEQLAHLSGMHRNQVSNLERNTSRDGGSADPHLSTVYSLARVLRVPPEMLMPDAAVAVTLRSRETADDTAWGAVEVELSRQLITELPREEAAPRSLGARPRD
ncbi:helix-turn-helix transcriptional regulator [Tomitella fengzijianii]|uniref:Helix-turn-helix transcriptional regulator n=1 Tax=Tomitella fengzijianii TaxID=2597660 RepID=A0A516X277_9ACTN|nr:helix-turn-helix transcriptional regulator [Tomitella fengzijianii]QDQ97127.1 helix-turn-helix transcriptional regulator [Tomitella fengzijianii]